MIQEKLRLQDEPEFNLRHTWWYSFYYFGLITALIPLLVWLIASFFIDVSTLDDLPIGLLSLVYIAGFLIFVLKSKEVLRLEWQTFRLDLSKNLRTIFVLQIYTSVIVVIINTLLAGITGQENSSNQIQINEISQAAPWFIVFITLVFAPIVEELLFRGGYYFSLMKSGMRERKATIISFMSFGLLHVVSNLVGDNGFQFVELWFAIPYCFMGYMFVRAARKTGSIWGSIVMHFLNNALSVVIILVFLFL